MPPQPPALKTRLKTLNAILTSKKDREIVKKALETTEGDFAKALPKLEAKLSDTALKKVSFAHSLAGLSEDHLPFVKALINDPEIRSLRDVALRFNAEKLTALVDPKALPEGDPSDTEDEKKRKFAIKLQHRLFNAEPTAVLHRMVREAEVPIVDKNLRAGIVSFLSNQPEFNIRTESVYSAFSRTDSFKGIAEEHRVGVVEHLKTLQRVQAITPVPEAIPVLMKENLTSAFRVAELPESTFLSAHRTTLGEEAAKQVYTNAINAHIRNEHALMTMRETMRGSGLAIIDGSQPVEARKARLQNVATQNAVPLNLETLLGSIDHCECEECLSVYSPAAYFVDILQYLRNNNLDPSNPPGDPKSVAGTPLEKLFRRRPDLGCLELTCENTFTVLPYIDLVNEVMESFVVHLDKYEADTNVPKQATLEVFNVDDETTAELLAQPQHINYQAYCILKNAVYPFTLPYHQPIDAIRIWLKYMGTTRYKLLNTFRTANDTFDHSALTRDLQKELRKLYPTVLDRAVDAEFLGLTEEEYIILTREAFRPKRYFDLTGPRDLSEAEYHEKIRVRSVPEYYGYERDNTADMLDTDESKQIGLTFVKKQFLRRTGIQYVDLVELLKTRLINPAYPQGKALTLMLAMRFSYRFLQKLLDTSSTDPKVRFAKLIEFLNPQQPLAAELEAMLHPDPCHVHITDTCLSATDFSDWVYCYFERIGKLIVLESGEGPLLPIEGELLTADRPAKLVGTLSREGQVMDPAGTVIGNVTITGKVVTQDGHSFVDKFGNGFLSINEGANFLGIIDSEGRLRNKDQQLVNWLPPRDTCDLEKVRLAHLDGSNVTEPEYDRMQRFIRLWRKLGWTIDETDQALIGSSTKLIVERPSGIPPGDSGHSYVDDCTAAGEEDGCGDGNGDSNCPDIPPAPEDISTSFLHQLRAVRKVLDLTGLPLNKQLTFWANISTAGKKSLYARLFLTHNLLAIDKVFQSDANGNYLTRSAKISEHLPVLTAALKMKADDIAALIAFRELPDVLDLTTVSVLYRHSLLAKILHVRVEDLPEIIALFGDPFKNAQDTLRLLKTWGKMEDAGFTFGQLNYIIRDKDDPRRQLAPTKRTILTIAKTLYDGLNVIDREHKDVPEDHIEEATADLVRAKAGILYDQAVVEQIVGLLEGTAIYSTNAPANQSVTVPDALQSKLKYNNQRDANPPSATIQVTGILTETEKTQAKILSNDPGWTKAIDRVGKQALQIFNDKLFGIFPNADKAKEKLLAGDINVAPDPQNPSATDDNTAPGKRFYFLQYFMPFLRRRLAHQFIVVNLAGAVSLANDVTDVLLSDVLLIGAAKQLAIDALEQIHQQPAASGPDWKGYLIPTVDDSYTFVAKSLVGEAAPPDLVIDGDSKKFIYQQEDPSNLWSTDPVPLKNGKPYLLEVKGQSAAGLQWKTSLSPTTTIPISSLLPDYSSAGTEEVFIKLYKAALLVNGFNLSVAEISYWQTHGSDFADGTHDFNFNNLRLEHWRRLQAYASLRDKLPKTETSLLDLFQWASRPGDPAKLSQQIAAATLWKPEDIEKLIGPGHFDLKQPEFFRNEINLVKLLKALKIAQDVGAGIDRLFKWANPTSKFMICHQIAEGVRATLRARYDQEDWEKVVRPLNDQLREHQKQALISYLLVQKVLIDWGVIDADSLFEFFLIDVQMDACMETSRIKQAISSVQLFVQRCLLGLEDRVENGVQVGVPADVLDRDRWEWMQKYRVWEANRKVFLYPENWIKSELRDDKSPFYKELESELLQKDINPQTIEDALKSYLFKVDEVANLKVVGLFLEQEINPNGVPENDLKLHVFSRTRNAPYFFYYRYFDVKEGNWYPWERVQVDIPVYERDNGKGQIIESGTYLIPVVWNNRLLIFFPQFLKKTSQTSPVSGTKFNDIGDKKPSEAQSPDFWEIKMAWSEFRNAKWTQKQVSSDVIYNPATPGTKLPSISFYEFVPRLVGNRKVVIDVYLPKRTISPSGGPPPPPKPSPAIGAYHFAGSQIFGNKALVDPNTPPFFSAFHYLGAVNPPAEIHSLQAMSTNPPSLVTTEPFFEVHSVSDVPSVKLNFGPSSSDFYHPFAHTLLSQLAAGGPETLYDYYAGLSKDTVPHRVDAFGGSAAPTLYHELKRPYSIYNWEAAFHVPMQLSERFLGAKQFDRALETCHYVFNPYASGTDDKRFWQFPPFKEITAVNVLETLFLGLQPNQPNKDINEWREKPFQPHVVARNRPSAYMKWIVMKYIEILIAYGDYYFRQNTLETIPLAIQAYVLASHIYGPRGQEIPKRGKHLPQTYNSLLDKWDAFSNAMVELELVFPFSNQTSLQAGESNGVVGLPNVFGFASTLYFCIPDNPQLRAVRDTIDDRLFKLRHCQDIEGVVRHLPLFEPPIDPSLLIQAAAQGLSLSSVLNDLNSPMPNYRFYYLLQKALELCTEIKGLGNAFLSAKEKCDAEALSKLRAKHESSIHNLVMEVRKQQLDEANKSLEALQQSRKGPVYRLQHYLKLIGEDLGKVPDGNSDFGELPDTIEQPVDESGLKLIAYEKEEMDKASEAAEFQYASGIVETLGSILHLIPQIEAAVEPIGVGAGLNFGGVHLGSALQAVARGLQVHSSHLSAQSSSASRKGSFLRQLQDRVQQANSAGYEIKNIDKQILTQQIRISLTNQEITNQQKQIDNAQEVEEFLRNKYTNQELYSWMDSEIRTLYYQAYTLAYDLAKRAEKVFRFERGLTSTNFIQFGYWDIAHDGLLAGERLYVGLKQLEAAFQEKRGHDFEISKSISLRQLNPVALLKLRETGFCEFDLPEVLFDMDYPGHYLRRTKAVGLRIPCIVGAHTSLNCTLRLLQHKFRTSPVAKDKKDYLEKTDETDERFSTINVPITSIAVSSLEDEAGVFELNFHDERYLPFEGAGVISTWRIELPKQFRQFDYDTITDVIIRLRYTSLDGGDKLKQPASDSVLEYIKSIDELTRDEGLFAAFDLKNDFSNEWYAANHPPAGATQRLLTIDKLNEKLPIFTKGRPPAKIQATDIYLFASGSLLASSITVTQGGNDIPFTDGPTVGTMKSFVAKDVNSAMDSAQIKIADTTTTIEKMWLLERYILT
jgi:hypothetical protein